MSSNGGGVFLSSYFYWSQSNYWGILNVVYWVLKSFWHLKACSVDVRRCMNCLQSENNYDSFLRHRFRHLQSAPLWVCGALFVNKTSEWIGDFEPSWLSIFLIEWSSTSFRTVSTHVLSSSRWTLGNVKIICGWCARIILQRNWSIFS